MGEDSIQQLKNRFAELARRAEQHCIWTGTDFLSMAEQDALLSMGLPAILLGGYDGAERRIACFGSEDMTGYPCTPDIACLKITPSARKFADDLAHRDVLGALMSLGIDRRTTGDILIMDNTAYLFCLGVMADYIMKNLTSIRRTTVECALSDPPAQLSAPPEPVTFTLSSERLDALVAAVYRLGRTAAKELVLSGRVYINGRLCLHPDAQVPQNAAVSVRGKGRFRYEGALRKTKKGRLAVSVRVY